MKNQRPIFWHQGLFLQPQHFQLSDMYHQSLLTPFAKFANPYMWGVSSLTFNAESLENGMLAIDEAELVFPDGTYVTFPGNGVIRSRSLEDAPLEGGRPLKVFLGLKKLDQASDNVTEVSSLEDVGAITSRFVTTSDPEDVADLYQDGPQAKVKRLSYVPRIFWESEKDELSKYVLIPAAVLEAGEDKVRLSARFIPPSLRIDSAPQLMGLIKDVYDKLSARCRRLEEYKSPRGMRSGEIEGGVFFLLMGLRTLSRYALWLHHMMDTREVHPWNVYEVLVQMVGELTTFSQTMSATGEDVTGAKVVPPYKHLDLEYSYSRLHKLISRLLDDITYGPEAIIKLELADQYYQGEMEPAVFSDKNVYYLSLRTDLDKAEVVDAIGSVSKLSAKENLPILISRALPGLVLEYLPVPPPGLPQIGNASYFRIDLSGTQWDDVRRDGNIALHWNAAPEDLIAEVIVMRRS